MIRYLALMLFLLSEAWGIISIKPVEIGAKPGVSGKALLSISNKRGNSETDNYAGGLRVQYDNNESFVIWGDISGEYGEASGIKNTNKLYTHLRFIHALTQKSIRWELFDQLERNEFQQIKKRHLIGADLRFQLSDDFFGKGGKLFYGLGVFDERITYLTPSDPSENNYRMNNYLAYSHILGEDSTLNYTAYYQPRFDDFSDYIMSHAIALKIHIYLKLYYKLTLYYDYDSVPAKGVKSLDFTHVSAFIYEFGGN